jgi:hypothetical protein
MIADPGWRFTESPEVAPSPAADNTSPLLLGSRRRRGEFRTTQLDAAVAGQGDAEPDGGGLAGDGQRDLMPGPVAAARGGQAAAMVEQGALTGSSGGLLTARCSPAWPACRVPKRRISG